MIPAASDSPAEAQVCTWFAWSTEPRRSTTRRTSMAMTAAGMDAETVMPAFRPT